MFIGIGTVYFIDFLLIHIHIHTIEIEFASILSIQYQQIDRAKMSDADASSTREPIDIIPSDVRDFFVKYEENREILKKIVRQIERLLEMQSTKQQIPNEVPTLEPLTLSIKGKLAEALDRVRIIVAETPGALLDEVVQATIASLIDQAALERQNLVKENQTIIEKIFKAYLVNEVPEIDRKIHETKTLANLLIKLRERGDPTLAAAGYTNRYDQCLMEIRQHIADFPERQKKFADAMKQFTRDLHIHFLQGRKSIDATLELLEDQIEHRSRGQQQQKKE